MQCLSDQIDCHLLRKNIFYLLFLGGLIIIYLLFFFAMDLELTEGLTFFKCFFPTKWIANWSLLDKVKLHVSHLNPEMAFRSLFTETKALIRT